jgi:hypothetical protein
MRQTIGTVSFYYADSKKQASTKGERHFTMPMGINILAFHFHFREVHSMPVIIADNSED